MNYSNKLNLDIFFSALHDKKYAIIKLADFPNYYSGNDIDIFCYDIKEIALEIIHTGRQYVKNKFEIRVKNSNLTHIYIDFYIDNKLEFRFDLYGELPAYKKLHIKKDYFATIIDNRTSIVYEYNNKQYHVYTPSLMDDLVLRYVEYIEWYELRPDKIKHLNYILDSLSADEGRTIFLDKLHKYTELPDNNNNIDSEKKQRDKYLSSHFLEVIENRSKCLSKLIQKYKI